MAGILSVDAPQALAHQNPAHAGIYRLEAAILRMPQVDMPVEHAHCDGVYARTMRIPAGTVLTGAVHRAESFFLVRRGTLAVTTDDGVAMLNAGDMRITRAGTKRAGVAITDVEVTTFHANPSGETDPTQLWDLFTQPAPALVFESPSPEVLA